MSVLSDTQILSKLYEKELSIQPLILEHIQPSSIDLTLDENIQVPKSGVTISPPYPNREELEQYFDEAKLDGGFVLRPGQFVIAQIGETLHLSSDMTGTIQNRNSIVRFGVNVGLSSYINPGYKGKLPIAIHNIGSFDFTLVPGMRICQLVLNETSQVLKDYSKREDSKYHGEEQITLSRLSEDKEFVACLSKLGKSKDTKKIAQFLKQRIEEKSQDFFRNLSPEQKIALGL